MTHRLWFLLSLLLIGVFLYYAWVILLPITLSAILAYLLLPAKKALIVRGLPNRLSTWLVFFPFFSLVLLFFVILIPIFQREFWNFLMMLPEYGEMIRDHLHHWQLHLTGNKLLSQFSELKIDISSFMPDAISFVKSTLLRLLQNTSLIADILIYAILVPLFTFYFLRDADYIFNTLGKLIPRLYSNTSFKILRDINVRLVSYIRGQFLLSIIFSIYYMSCLSAVGLKHGLVLGFLTGTFFFVPMLTFYISFIAALVIGYVQFDTSLAFWGVIGIYMIGQILESFILVPRVMGNKIGLNPLWIILALYVGGAIFGVVGLLISIPVAAVLDVLIRHSLKVYFQSSYYRSQH